MRRYSLLIGGFILLAFGVAAASSQFYNLPPLPHPSQYGNVLISRQTADMTMPTVSFSHWSHRTRYTCRVCHFELEFAMEANATEITEKDNQSGKFCGTCHNGEIAFGHTKESCAYCHNFGMDGSQKRFDSVKNLPWVPNGNEIDWVRAQEEGLIEPKQSVLEEDFQPMEFTRELQIEADWGLIPGAEFPHDKHQQWLDCANCHPDIFDIKLKGTLHFDMQYNLEGKFCGACHLKVAFPMDDCKRCHPKMSNSFK
jgi:c(7)-type cytochrome triheme protein